ncbi:MAG TPA: condensation domain-containing protein, partial [Sphingorhabdus sp.]|uniref:condensation domain-containing protein n=1 Tax=Sphingorhabdus sp. TaxID=1902408 RepID=UPI002C1E2AB6
MIGISEQSTVLPLSAAQRGVWFGHLLDPSSYAYNIGQYTEIGGEIDLSCFEKAAAHVLAGTEALRLNIFEAEAGLFQSISPQVVGVLVVVDVSDEPDPHHAALAIMRVELVRPFDLACNPLVRWRLIRLAPNHFYWLQVNHHIAVDGYAGSLIAQRMAQSYTALVKGESLPEWPCVYESLIEADQRYPGSEHEAVDRAYWHALLEDREPAQAWSGLSNSNGKAFVRRTVLLSPKLTEWLRKSDGPGLGAWLILAAARLQALHDRNADVVLGMPLLGRFGKLERATPSMASNVGHLRLDLSPHILISDLADDINRRIRTALRHQKYPHEALQREFSPETRRGLVAFSVNLSSFDYGLEFGNLKTLTHNLSNGSIEGLSLNVYDQADSSTLRLDLNGNSELYEEKDLASYLAMLVQLLEGLAEVPAHSVA